MIQPLQGLTIITIVPMWTLEK